jgi:hypothetical protein
MKDLRYCDHNRDYERGTDDGWWEYDARGIPLAKVCDKCRKTKLAGYRPDVLRDPNYEHDEPISEEHWDY